MDGTLRVRDHALRVRRRRCVLATHHSSHRIDRVVILIVTLSGALVLAGCGGSDVARLPSSYAGPAVAQADRIGRLLDGRRQCAASSLAVRLQARTIDAINAGSIPPPLQEDLLGRVNLLVASIPCGAMDRQARDPTELARALADWLRDHAAES